MDLWEWDVRVLDIQQGIQDDHTPLCLGGRGAPPPEHCGGPRRYRLMLKRQQEGGAIADLASVEATIQMLVSTHPDQPARTWDATDADQSLEQRTRGGVPPLVSAVSCSSCVTPDFLTHSRRRRS